MSATPPICDFDWPAPPFSLPATDGKTYSFDVWGGERLPDQLLAYDVETAAIEGSEIPQLVLATVFYELHQGLLPARVPFGDTELFMVSEEEAKTPWYQDFRKRVGAVLSEDIGIDAASPERGHAALIQAVEIHELQHQIDYKDKTDPEKLEVDPEIVISGIDELKMMEDLLMKPKTLPG